MASIPSENFKQQDGKRRGSRATSRTSSRHLGCSPLQCLIPSSNHVAWHTKRIVIFRNIMERAWGDQNEKLDSDQREIHGSSLRYCKPKKPRSEREFYGTALSIQGSPHDLYNGLYPERMRGQIGVTWTLRIYQLPSLAHLLYSHFVSSETFGNRPRRRQRKNATSVTETHSSFFSVHQYFGINWIPLKPNRSIPEK